MSLLWRDRLQVVLSPRQVILVRLGKGLRPRVAAKEVVACGDPADGAAAWQPALDALPPLLAERRWKHAEARVILSNHFVRYLLVPWQEKVSGPDEQEALVRYSLAEVYGEAAGDWQVIWSEGRPPAPSLVCAVDGLLLAGLRDVFGTAGIGLASIQPYLVAAFNRWRRDLDGRQDWFLLAEPGRLCLAWFQDDEWAGLNCQQVGEGWGQELPQILERALLLAGQQDAPARLCINAPDVPQDSLVLAEGWSGSWLEPPACPGFVPAEDGAYAMAMNAA